MDEAAFLCANALGKCTSPLPHPPVGKNVLFRFGKATGLKGLDLVLWHIKLVLKEKLNTKFSGVLFRRIYDILAHYSSIIRSSQKCSWFSTSLYCYKQNDLCLLLVGGRKDGFMAFSCELVKGHVNSLGQNLNLAFQFNFLLY